MKLMKAIQVRTPGGDFELVQREIPKPIEGQVRIQVLACGVCHGDAIVKDGGSFIDIEYPRIPGHEVIGVVDKLGPNVRGYEIGQWVGVGWPAGITYDGGFAEYMITRAEELILIPDELNDIEGAPLLCAGTTTYDALRNSGARPGDVVAIQGVGGLIPYWAKDPSIGHKLINARAETVDEKPSFKTCLQRKRCLIVADGFYEWKKEGTTKHPHRITLKDQGLFSFAGLWDTWKSPTGELVNSCTIITTTPNELMAPLHNRMPVILPRDVEQVWLDQSITDSTFLKSLLTPYPSDQMMAYEVSPFINSVNNNGPQCLVTVGERLF